MKNYVLNIKTGKIHNGKRPCNQCTRCKESNKKYFDNYDEAVYFFEGKNEKGIPCGICLKQKDE